MAGILDDFNFDALDFIEKRKEKRAYYAKVKNGEIRFDNKDPLAIDMILDAGKFGDLQELKELKALGADFNVQDENGNTPLMNALYNKRTREHADCVAFMILQTTDFNIHNQRGENAAIIALRNECPNKLLLPILAKTDNVAEVKKDCDSILTAALSYDGLSLDNLGVILAKKTGQDKDEVTKNITANAANLNPYEQNVYKAQLLIMAGADATKAYGNLSAIVKAQSNIMKQQLQKIHELESGQKRDNSQEQTLSPVQMAIRNAKAFSK